MKKIFNTKLSIRRLRDKLRNVFPIIFSIVILGGFIFSTPSSDFKQTLVRNQIAEIEASNLASMQISNIAYAEEGTPICCSLGETPNEGEYCDNSACTPMCCTSGSNPNVGYRCDDSLCGGGGGDCHEDNSCPITSVCCDEYAINYVNIEEQEYPQDYDCEGTCSYVPICCDSNASNPATAEQRADLHNKCDSSVCEYPMTICCDGNWDTYIPPSARFPDDICDYGVPGGPGEICDCHTTPPHTGSQCGGDGNPPDCQVDTGFSVIKSGVTISGSATMLTTSPCNTNEDRSALAGMAAAAAGPDTPLNVPQSLGAFSSYTVTSKDWCQNITGNQDSEGYNRDNTGFCCEEPNIIQSAESNGVITKSCVTPPPEAACGDATLYPTESVPTNDLCDNGTASSVTTNQSSYTWTCTIPEDTASCTVTRMCGGQPCTDCTSNDCGVNDLCANIAGPQDSTYLSSNNLAADSAKYCWNIVSGACGNASQVPAPTGGPIANLCTAPSTLNSTPTYNGTSGKWEWNCNDTNGSQITPPSVCQATPCVGNQCTTTTSGLIRNLVAQPAIVSASDQFCTLAWESLIDGDTNANKEGFCTINGNSSLNGNVVYDDSPSSAGFVVQPGSYALTCTNDENLSETKSVKCIVKPDFKEI